MEKRVKEIIVFLFLIIGLLILVNKASLQYTGMSIYEGEITGNMEIFFECWENNSDGTYNAYFGYNNENNETNIPVGHDNRINKLPNNSSCQKTGNYVDCNQPTNFLMGRHEKVSSFTWDGKSGIVWHLKYIDIVKNTLTPRTVSISTENSSKECEMPCEPEWECGNWSECVNETSQRICIDINNCEQNKIEQKNCTTEIPENVTYSRMIEFEYDNITKIIKINLLTSENISDANFILIPNSSENMNSIEIIPEYDINDVLLKANITFYYNKSLINELNINESTLKLKNNINNTWELLNYTININDSYVFTEINHMSEYGLFFEKNNIENSTESNETTSPSPSPSGGSGSSGGSSGESSESSLNEEISTETSEERVLENEKDSKRKLEKKSPLCNDGIKNGDEEGVDCGGLCEPCNKSLLEKLNTLGWLNYILFVLLLASLTTLLRNEIIRK